MLTQKDNLTDDSYIVLILSKDDLLPYVDEDLADKLFNNDIFREYFENNLMQEQLLADQTGESVTAPELVSERLVNVITKPTYGVGSGWDAYKEQLSSLKSNDGTPDVVFPSAEAMLILGKAALERGEGVAAEDAQPVYVRDTVSWKKLPGR